MQYVHHLTWKRQLEMHLANRTRTVWDKRRRSIDTARLSFNAALPRTGRLVRQCGCALLIGQGVVSMKQLRAWCYPARQRRHWHQTNIRRALAKLGAERIGWGLYATCSQHSK
jgi:hypothetical protein